jgi:hypothetical protein
MQLLSPEILIEAKGLSPSVTIFGLILGFLLWLFGWRWHRFWVAMSITIAGGLIGLHAARSSGSNLLAFGLLLAISAGVLAIELSRLLAFVAGGMTVWLLSYYLFPNAHELWIAFLVGGLGGVLLYRLWMMLLTSFAGVLLSWHSGFCILQQYAGMNASQWATEHLVLINSLMIGITILGLLAQSLMERWDVKYQNRKKQSTEKKIREDERDRVLSELPPVPVKKKGSMWDRWMGRKKAA